MTITATGAEFKAYLSDERAWPNRQFYEDGEVVVNGKMSDPEQDYMTIPDNATVVVQGGWLQQNGQSDARPMDEHFEAWHAAQTSEIIVVTVAKTKAPAVHAAILAAQNEKRTRTLDETQLSLFFYIGAAKLDPENENETEYAVHQAAFKSIDATVHSLPIFHRLVDDNGFDTTDKDAMSVPRAGLYEDDGTTEAVAGRSAYYVAFYSTGEFPLDLAQALKAVCLTEYTKAAAAAGLRVEFAKADRHFSWTERETAPWLDL